MLLTGNGCHLQLTYSYQCQLFKSTQMVHLLKSKSRDPKYYTS